jgi:hypothetical protein
MLRSSESRCCLVLLIGCLAAELSCGRRSFSATLFRAAAAARPGSVWVLRPVIDTHGAINLSVSASSSRCSRSLPVYFIRSSTGTISAVSFGLAISAIALSVRVAGRGSRAEAAADGRTSAACVEPRAVAWERCRYYDDGHDQDPADAGRRDGESTGQVFGECGSVKSSSVCCCTSADCYLILLRCCWCRCSCYICFFFFVFLVAAVRPVERTRERNCAPSSPQSVRDSECSRAESKLISLDLFV